MVWGVILLTLFQAFSLSSREVSNFDIKAKKIIRFLQSYNLETNFTDQNSSLEQSHQNFLSALNQMILDLEEELNHETDAALINLRQDQLQKIVALQDFYLKELKLSPSASLYLAGVRALSAIYDELYVEQIWNFYSTFSYPFTSHYRLPGKLKESPKEKFLSELYKDYDKFTHSASDTKHLWAPNHQENWKRKESNFEYQVNSLSSAQDKLEKFGPYTLSRAREVLFFDHTKENNTSPKFRVKDLYKQKWQVKLGSESITEPVVSRLQSMLGLEGYDLNYNHHFKHTKQIIFFKDETLGNRSFGPNELLASLKGKPYKFDARDFVLDQGVVDAKNYLELAKYVSLNLLENSHFKKKVMGLSWMVFKESSVEFVGDKKYHLRLGQVSASELGANQIQSYRASSLFHFWVQSRDTKGQNHRMSLIKNEQGEWTLNEGFQDPGASLGGIQSDSMLNAMVELDKFLRLSNNEKKFIYHSKSVYRPLSWDFANYNDQIWMVSQIQALSIEDLRWAFSENRWPAQIVNAFIWHLLERQKLMSYYYGASLENPLNKKNQNDLTWVIHWDSLEQREILFTLYPEIKEDALRYLDEHPHYLRDEVISQKLQLNSCKNSLFLGLMEYHIHPAGVTRRPGRFFHSGRLKKCLP